MLLADVGEIGDASTISVLLTDISELYVGFILLRSCSIASVLVLLVRVADDTSKFLSLLVSVVGSMVVDRVIVGVAGLSRSSRDT